MFLTYPIPDEFALSHLTRLRILNDLDSDKAMADALWKFFEVRIPPNRKRQVTRVLAHIAGLDVRKYALKHTFWPYYQACGYTSDQSKTFVDHRRSDAANLKWLNPPKDYALFCEQCMQEQMEEHGTALWLRSPQLPGVHWCTKHDHPLKFITVKGAFSHPPNQWLEHSELINTAYITETTKRYAAVVKELLNVEKPVMPCQVKQVILDLLETTTTQPEKWACELQQFLTHSFPKEWLNKHFSVLIKRSKQPITSGLLSNFDESSLVKLYTLCLTASFEDSSDAIRHHAGAFESI